MFLQFGWKCRQRPTVCVAVLQAAPAFVKHSRPSVNPPSAHVFSLRATRHSLMYAFPTVDWWFLHFCACQGNLSWKISHACGKCLLTSKFSVSLNLIINNIFQWFKLKDCIHVFPAFVCFSLMFVKSVFAYDFLGSKPNLLPPSDCWFWSLFTDINIF